MTLIVVLSMQLAQFAGYSPSNDHLRTCRSHRCQERPFSLALALSYDFVNFQSNASGLSSSVSPESSCPNSSNRCSSMLFKALRNSSKLLEAPESSSQPFHALQSSPPKLFEAVRSTSKPPQASRSPSKLLFQARRCLTKPLQAIQSSSKLLDGVRSCSELFTAL